MNRHPYLRAYMAGVLLPSWFLLIVLAGFVIGRLVYQIPVPIERVIVFPMAVIPNLWGIWNVLYLATSARHRVTVGAWGALLPLILVPSGVFLERLLELSLFTPLEALIAVPVIAAVYYLIWKHAVSFLNNVAGVN